ncbi:hypothetical protein JCM19047_370 [Bacillus sp. JCM 19047]|nr:hypothetical protein JCM19047_370 [Bacillus sp. JCM 19047]
MWGIEPHFEPRKDPSSYTRADAPFKPEFSGYTLTKKDSGCTSWWESYDYSNK